MNWERTLPSVPVRLRDCLWSITLLVIVDLLVKKALESVEKRAKEVDKTRALVISARKLP